MTCTSPVFLTDPLFSSSPLPRLFPPALPPVSHNAQRASPPRWPTLWRNMRKKLAASLFSILRYGHLGSRLRTNTWTQSKGVTSPCVPVVLCFPLSFFFWKTRCPLQNHRWGGGSQLTMLKVLALAPSRCCIAFNAGQMFVSLVTSQVVFSLEVVVQRGNKPVVSVSVHVGRSKVNLINLVRR